MAALQKRVLGLVGFLSFSPFVPAVRAEVRVDPAIVYQTIEGWGTSLCWWANRVGALPEELEERIVWLLMDTEQGMGMNIFRYNIGGGDDPTHQHMSPGNDIPGFSPSPGVFDWSADANQRRVLSRILARDPQVILEAFSNSPPHWMTQSGCASGNVGGADNLADDRYGDFADYLTEVVRHFEDGGIRFRTLAPLNEPDTWWWKAKGHQEGCRFSPGNQDRLIREVGLRLRQKGLWGTALSAADENDINRAHQNFISYSREAQQAISQINFHSYSGYRRAELSNLARAHGKRLWMSESGPLSVPGLTNMTAAMLMAWVILQDLRDARASAWIDWQSLAGDETWGSLVMRDGPTFTLSKRFHMHRQFFRFIRPGYTIIDSDDPNTLAALDPSGERLVVVILNPDLEASADFNLDLSRFGKVGAAAELYRTSPTEDHVRLADVKIQDKRLSLSLGEASISTLVIAVGDTLTGGQIGALAVFALGAEPEKALDGSAATFWMAPYKASAVTPLTFTIALGSPTTVSQLHYLPLNDPDPSGRILDYQVQTSLDGSAFQPVAQGTFPAERGEKTVFFTPTPCRFVKLVVLSNVGSFVAAAGFDLTHQGVVPRQAMATMATSAQIDQENDSYRAIDGDSATFWHSAQGPSIELPQALTLDLAGSYRVSRLRVLPRQDRSPGGDIGVFRIHGSRNGKEFALLAEGSWASGKSEKSVALPGQELRFVRLEVLSGQGGLAAAAEIAVEHEGTRLVGPDHPVKTAGLARQGKGALGPFRANFRSGGTRGGERERGR